MGRVHCCSLSIRYACQLQLLTLHLTGDVVVQSMRMLLSFGVSRHMVHAAPEPSYEAMLALDENNPRRGVKKHILEGRRTYGTPFRQCLIQWMCRMHLRCSWLPVANLLPACMYSAGKTGKIAGSSDPFTYLSDA